MPYAAARLFEAYLSNRSQPFAKSAAAFSRALRKAQNRPPTNPERLGQGTGFKSNDFADMPHLMESGLIKVIPKTEYGGHKAIGEGHRDWNSYPNAPVLQVNNPYARLARLGHNMSIKEGKDRNDAAFLNVEHPNHPKHLIYISNLVKNAFDVEASHTVAHRAKKAGGLGGRALREAAGTGLWYTGNQHVQSRELPKTFEDTLARIHGGGSNRSAHAAHAVKTWLRSAQVVAGMNRMFHAAQSLGKKFDDIDPDEFTKHALYGRGSIEEYSQARIVPGFTRDILGNTRGHNPLAAADFDQGKPTGTVLRYFETPKGAARSGILRHTNLRDVASHIMQLPAIDLRDVKPANRGQYTILDNYRTPGTNDSVDAYRRTMGF